MKFKNKLLSVKLQLILLVIFLGYLALMFPPLVIGTVILTGTEFVSLVSLCLAAYFTANVAQKRIPSNISYDNDEGKQE